MTVPIKEPIWTEIARVSDEDALENEYNWKIDKQGQIYRDYGVSLAQAVIHRVFHRLVYDTEVIVFKDGDYSNCQRENLLLVDVVNQKLVIPPNP